MSIKLMTAMRMSHRRLLCVAAALSLFMSSQTSDAADGATAAQPRKTHTVTIEGTSFQPDRLTVAAGDTVVWINKDPFPHTAMASGAFDSRSIAPDKSWKLRAVKKGEFDYVCTLHPTMRARLTVK